MTGDIATAQVQTVLDAFNAALASNNAEGLAKCFYAEQAFWRDIVALTSHLRTIAKSDIIASALLERHAVQQISGKVELEKDAQFSVMSPVMVSSIVLPPTNIETNV